MSSKRCNALIAAGVGVLLFAGFAVYYTSVMKHPVSGDKETYLVSDPFSAFNWPMVLAGLMTVTEIETSKSVTVSDVAKHVLYFERGVFFEKDSAVYQYKLEWSASTQKYLLWCPKSMDPTSDLAVYGERLPSLVEALVQQHSGALQRILAETDPEAVDDTDRELLTQIFTAGCPQAAPRPELPAVIPEYNALTYRCNADDNYGKGHSLKAEDGEDRVLWSEEYLDYRPRYLIVENDDLYRHNPLMIQTPEDVRQTTITTIDFKEQENRLIARVFQNKHMIPWNPCGRTGILGRLDYSRYGPNHTTQLLVTREVPLNGGDSPFEVQILLENRILVSVTEEGDIFHELGIPEAKFETVKSFELVTKNSDPDGIVIKQRDVPFVKTVYKGYFDTMVNTDNAWMETTVIWKHLPYFEFYESFKDQLAIENSPANLIKVAIYNLKVIGVALRESGALSHIFDTGSQLPSGRVTPAVRKARKACDNLMTPTEATTCQEKLEYLLNTGDQDLDTVTAENLYARLFNAHESNFPGDSVFELRGYEQIAQATMAAPIYDLNNSKTEKSLDPTELKLEVLRNAVAATSGADLPEEEDAGMSWMKLETVARKDKIYFNGMNSYFVKQVAIMLQANPDNQV